MTGHVIFDLTQMMTEYLDFIFNTTLSNTSLSVYTIYNISSYLIVCYYVVLRFAGEETNTEVDLVNS